MNKDLISKLNKKLVRKDGNIMNFEKQLDQSWKKKLSRSMPLVISADSDNLFFINKEENSLPLIIKPKTLDKIQTDHSLNNDFKKSLKELIRNALFAFDSKEYESSKVIVLDEVDIKGRPVIAVCRLNKKWALNMELNEITSIYGRDELSKLIDVSFEKNLNFYVNKKIEYNSPSLSFRMPQECKFALSNYYDKAVFNKSQVENDLKAILKPTSIAEQIQKAKYKSQDRQQASISKNIVKNRNKDKER